MTLFTADINNSILMKAVSFFTFIFIIIIIVYYHNYNLINSIAFNLKDNSQYNHKFNYNSNLIINVSNDFNHDKNSISDSILDHHHYANSKKNDNNRYIYKIDNIDIKMKSSKSRAYNIVDKKNIKLAGKIYHILSKIKYHFQLFLNKKYHKYGNIIMRILNKRKIPYHHHHHHHNQTAIDGMDRFIVTYHDNSNNNNNNNNTKDYYNDKNSSTSIISKSKLILSPPPPAIINDHIEMDIELLLPLELLPSQVQMVYKSYHIILNSSLNNIHNHSSSTDIIINKSSVNINDSTSDQHLLITDDASLTHYPVTPHLVYRYYQAIDWSSMYNGKR